MHLYPQVIVRPLMAGERVTLSVSVNVTGVVEQLDFLQTVIRTDTHIPYTVPNKVLAPACLTFMIVILKRSIKHQDARGSLWGMDVPFLQLPGASAPLMPRCMTQNKAPFPYYNPCSPEPVRL